MWKGQARHFILVKNANNETREVFKLKTFGIFFLWVGGFQTKTTLISLLLASYFKTDLITLFNQTLFLIIFYL